MKIPKWSVTTGPTGRVVDFALVKSHLNQIPDSEQTYVEGLIDAATDYAMEKMACSLITQTITAIYTPQNVYLNPQVNDLLQPFIVTTPLNYDGRSPCLYLPRGPVIAISSLKDVNNNNVAYALERSGRGDYLRMTGNLATCPLTAVYSAGYANAAAVPAMIRQAILAHVGTLYAIRESVLDRTLSVVPHSLEEFYKLRSRNIGIA